MFYHTLWVLWCKDIMKYQSISVLLDQEAGVFVLYSASIIPSSGDFVKVVCECCQHNFTELLNMEINFCSDGSNYMLEELAYSTIVKVER